MRLLILTVVAVVAAAIVMAVALSPPSRVPATPVAVAKAPTKSKFSRPQPGDEVIFADKGGASWVAMSAQVDKELTTLAIRKDHATIEFLQTAGMIWLVDDGTTATVIETGTLRIMVRLTSGPHVGKDCWTPPEAVKLVD